MSKRQKSQYQMESDVSVSDEDDKLIINDQLSAQTHANDYGSTSESNDADAMPIAKKKRGRGPSKQPCSSKNALAARDNRRKKKEYIENIENALLKYKNENKKLNHVIGLQKMELKKLNNQVLYFKNVINQTSGIKSLLQSINDSLSSKNGNQKRIDESSTMENHQKDHFYDGKSISSNDNDEGIKPSGMFLQSNSNQSDSVNQFDFIIPHNDFESLGNMDQDLFSSLDGSSKGYFTNENSPADNSSTALFENLGNSGVCLHVNSQKEKAEKSNLNGGLH